MRAVAFLGALSLVVAACGGAPDSPLLGGDSGTTGNDGGGGPDVITNDAPGTCDLAKCNITVPDTFSLVTMTATSCPSGWGSRAGVTAPTAGDGTCTCDCNVTAQPDCSTGTIQRFDDLTTTASCSQTATTLTGDGTACQQLYYGIYLQGVHYKVDAPPPTGGTCKFDAKLDTGKVTSTPTNLCTPPTGCPGAVCGSSNVCVSKTGNVACPTSFPAKSLVGASATATCGDCGTSCSVGGTCTGTLNLYTDQYCQAVTKATFTADSMCKASTGTVTNYYSFNYKGSVVTADCGQGPPPTSMPTASLDSPTTICCQH
jgi:hypothetical protein